ncbi:MAG: hypothetical protein PHG45_00520 [Dehalococcoidales bacterium]|nr:hypothetical protein [Dehalococcoidales bacterium]
MNCRMSRPATPYQGATVSFVGKHLVYRCLTPFLSGTGAKAFAVEHNGDILAAFPLQGHVEHASDYTHCNGTLTFRCKLVAFPAVVIHRHLFHAVWSPPAAVISPLGVFPHASFYVLPQVGAVKLVDALDDAFKQLPGRVFIERFIDGNKPYADILKQLLVGYRVDTAPGKPVQLPYQDGFEGMSFRFGQSYHLFESRPHV